MFHKKWFLELSIYLVWFPIVALFFWLAIQLRTAIEIGLSAFYVGTNPYNFKVADVIDKYSFAAIICIWIVVIILIEGHLRNGVRDQSMTKRFTRIFGPGLVALGVVDLFNVLMPATNITGWPNWLAIAVELLAGSAITYYGFYRLGRKPESKTAQS
jgi:hypothetical protein